MDRCIVQLPSKIISNARSGAYVNFGDVRLALDPVSHMAEPCPELPQSNKKNTKPISNFYTWLRVWNTYEQLIMASHSHKYWHLTAYRKFIQDCDRKYLWSDVYCFDTRFHNYLASTSMPFKFGNTSTDLFVTTLEATAVVHLGVAKLNIMYKQQSHFLIVLGYWHLHT